MALKMMLTDHINKGSIMKNKTDLIPPAGTTHTIKDGHGKSPLWNTIKVLGNKGFYFNGTQWMDILDENYLGYYLKYYDVVTHEEIPTETPEEAEAFNKMKPYEFDGHVSGKLTRIISNGHEPKIVSYTNDKPVFTQAMADAGELPPVGSKFLHNGEVVLCISTTSHDGGVVTFRRITQGNGPDIACCWNNKSWVKPILIPIDTRTPKQKAVDEMMNSLSDYCKEQLSEDLLREICQEIEDIGYEKKC